MPERIQLILPLHKPSQRDWLFNYRARESVKHLHLLYRILRLQTHYQIAF